jgi:hypothetical protein
MEEPEAIQFYEDVVGGENHAETDRKEFVLEAANNRDLEIYLERLDRKYVIDQLNKLPDEMLEMFAEAEDPEDIDEEEATQALSGLSGDAIEAFENICQKSMNHAQLTDHHFEEMVTELDLEVLFEMGSRVIEMSLDEGGKITGFRERN